MPVVDTERYNKLNDVLIDSITITSDLGGAVELGGDSNMCKHITIYEEINSPCLTGYVYISDGMNLISHLPITGHETLNVKFKTPGIGSSTISLDFDVYSITDRTKATNDRNEMYRLNLISTGFRFSEIQRVSRAYSGKISEMVERIINDYFPPDTKYLIQETKGEHKFVIPNLKPIDAINWLAERAVSEHQPHDTNYKFFQSLDHYNFLAMGRVAGGAPMRKYYMKPAGMNNQDLLDQMMNVQDFETNRDFDRASDIKNGLYTSRLWTHDITTKKLTKQIFNYRMSFNESNHVEEHPVLPQLSKHTKSFNGPTFVKPKQNKPFDGLYPENYNPEDWLLKRKSSVGLYGNKIINIRVAGDSKLRVGGIAEIKIPSNEPLETHDQEWFDKYGSGRHLITTIRHIIANSGSGDYTCMLELARDSLPTQIPDQKTFLGSDNTNEDTEILQS
tara:strand:- start:1271 stop:2614 length:1344 start_codon:yes stop_codon:yes gene_type:complete